MFGMMIGLIWMMIWLHLDDGWGALHANVLGMCSQREPPSMGHTVRIQHHYQKGSFRAFVGHKATHVRIYSDILYLLSIRRPPRKNGFHDFRNLGNSTGEKRIVWKSAYILHGDMSLGGDGRIWRRTETCKSIHIDAVDDLKKGGNI